MDLRVCKYLPSIRLEEIKKNATQNDQSTSRDVPLDLSNKKQIVPTSNSAWKPCSYIQGNRTKGTKSGSSEWSQNYATELHK
jgi:hypothetical protein